MPFILIVVCPAGDIFLLHILDLWFVEWIWYRIIDRFRMVLKDREVLGEQNEEQDVRSDDSERHQGFYQRGQINIVGIHHTEHRNVEAIEDQSENHVCTGLRNGGGRVVTPWTFSQE